MSVYMSGSKAMSYDSEALATSDIKWLGVRPSDLDRYKIPEQCRLDMTQADIDMGEKLLKEEFIQKNPEWMKELQLMLKMKKKVPIANCLLLIDIHFLPSALHSRPRPSVNTTLPPRTVTLFRLGCPPAPAPVYMRLCLQY